MEPFSTPREKFLYLRKRKPPKKFIILSQKKAVLIFQETETPKKFLCNSGNGTSYISEGNM